MERCLVGRPHHRRLVSDLPARHPMEFSDVLFCGRPRTSHAARRPFCGSGGPSPRYRGLLCVSHCRCRSQTQARTGHSGRRGNRLRSLFAEPGRGLLSISLGLWPRIGRHHSASSLRRFHCGRLPWSRQPGNTCCGNPYRTVVIDVTRWIQSLLPGHQPADHGQCRRIIGKHHRQLL